jgi:glutamine synthetase
MVGAGMVVESSKGECAPGQQEIALQHEDPLTTADHHCVYKLGVRELAASHGLSATFMAKYSVSEGNSCHVHLSLWSADGSAAFTDLAGGDSRTLSHFLAGLRSFLPELTLFMAPNVNSYKRFVAGSFAPVNVAWDYDNRTCGLRLVGGGSSRRIENRIPGADVNPYLALAATLAAGCEGVSQGMDPGPPAGGNAYDARPEQHPQLPGSLEEAVVALNGSCLARRVFGDEVVDHYVRAGEVELGAFRRAVTDWERRRGFERL